MSRRSLPMLVLIAIGAAATFGHTVDAMQTETIISLERAALDRWGRGDPEGYLELYAHDVTYFDPMRGKRVDGIDAMRKLLEPIKGLIKVDRYEMTVARRVGRSSPVGTRRSCTARSTDSGRYFTATGRLRNLSSRFRVSRRAAVSCANS